MMLLKKNFSFVFIIVCMPLLMQFSSCHKDSATPSYVYVNPFILKIDSVAQGTSNNKIEDVWLYVNEQSLGAYQLPAKIPVIANGSTQLLLSPGVLKNGITTMHFQYPFYTAYFDTVVLTKSQTTVITPIVKYIDSAKFHLNETFENGNTFSKLIGDTTIYRDNQPSERLWSQWYGKITLTPTNDTVEVYTPYFTLPYNSIVFIEMNYKCDIPITIGLLVNNSSGGEKYWVETLNAHSTWNKIYIDISDAVTQLQGTSYGIILKAGNTSGDITSPQNIYLDNIKLISK